MSHSMLSQKIQWLGFRFSSEICFFPRDSFGKCLLPSPYSDFLSWGITFVNAFLTFLSLVCLMWCIVQHPSQTTSITSLIRHVIAMLLLSWWNCTNLMHMPHWYYYYLFLNKHLFFKINFWQLYVNFKNLQSTN